MREQTPDSFLGTCVAGHSFHCGAPTPSPRHDFCVEHADWSDFTFGRCYNCKDGDHDQCVGVPCRCECPTPDQREREELKRQALSKLTPQEIAALGVR